MRVIRNVVNEHLLHCTWAFKTLNLTTIVAFPVLFLAHPHVRCAVAFCILPSSFCHPLVSCYRDCRAKNCVQNVASNKRSGYHIAEMIAE